jgi:hypothetical protein
MKSFLWFYCIGGNYSTDKEEEKVKVWVRRREGGRVGQGGVW